MSKIHILAPKAPKTPIKSRVSTSLADIERNCNPKLQDLPNWRLNSNNNFSNIIYFRVDKLKILGKFVSINGKLKIFGFYQLS